MYVYIYILIYIYIYTYTYIQHGYDFFIRMNDNDLTVTTSYHDVWMNGSSSPRLETSGLQLGKVIYGDFDGDLW